MRTRLLLLTMLICGVAFAQQNAQSASDNSSSASVQSGASQSDGAQALSKQELSQLVPQNYFFAGQTATSQTRNSGGVRFADKKIVLLALVDNSGYSSGVQQKYQGLLITEVPLKVGDKTVPAGSYGFGMPSADQFVVLDINANEIASGQATTDSNMKRPVPLRVASSGDTVTVSMGRKTFSLSRASQ